MNEDALHDLQVKVAFLEDAMVKLSDEYYAQQRELAELKSKYASLVVRMRSLPSQEDGDSHSSDERPPHY
ncbi:SlyX family protein [Arenicella xantha]|uniref:SlyX protein n=1 Tax=Arenicella xantha TaxID=644221 RepID=A0A395JHD2_9GAMM|nr:SlyX family protein [Arenicella xantha]RBP49316.1 SlyX protein [Arenicella xantha]